MTPEFAEQLSKTALALFREQSDQSRLWDELFAILALVPLQSEGCAHDLLQHAADLEYNLTGAAEFVGGLLERCFCSSLGLTPEQDRESAARGQLLFKRLMSVAAAHRREGKDHG